MTDCDNAMSGDVNAMDCAAVDCVAENAGVERDVGTVDCVAADCAAADCVAADCAAVETKTKLLDESLRALAQEGNVAVAFSGGVDSAFLLLYAYRLLGNKVIAITAGSVFLPEEERLFAERFCSENDIEHHFVEIDVLSDGDIAANPPDRCYKCKKLIMKQVQNKASELGCLSVLDGTNYDDIQDYRPGMLALEELGIISPLKDVGFVKSEIRSLSHDMGLSIWDKPASACLATRFPHNVPLRASRLNAVGKAESLLHDLGFTQCRVRVHGDNLDVARIEVLPDQISRLMDERIHSVVNEGLTDLGFKYVCVDLGGYRTGSMNIS